jgi:Zn-finger nucleic acid-binding protein
MPRIPLRLGSEQKDHLDIERCTHGHGLWCDDGELQRLLSMSPPRGRAHEVIDYLNQLLGAAQGE